MASIKGPGDREAYDGKSIAYADSPHCMSQLVCLLPAEAL